MADVVSEIFAVFTQISTWFSSALPALYPLFYSNGLTFLGVLAVVGLGFSVIFLLIGVIQNFLHFRG